MYQVDNMNTKFQEQKKIGKQCKELFIIKIISYYYHQCYKEYKDMFQLLLL